MANTKADRERFLLDILALESELRAYLRHLCCHDIEKINDCVNETYLRVLGIEDWYKFPSRAALLKRIARNFFLDQFKREKMLNNYVWSEVNQDGQARRGISPEDVVAEQRDIERLLEHVEALPRQQRQVLILRSWEGMSHDQISRKMGLSVSTIEKHVSRARSSLRKHC